MFIRNGVRLISGTDFVGTSGTNFFLTDAAAVNDELEAIGYTITSIINASTSFDNLNVTGITTTGRLNVSTNAVVTGILTAGNTVVGGATTQLVVVGNARITGILSIGQGTVTIDGSNNQVNVGTAVTIHHTNGFQVGGNSLHSTGISVNNINSSGIVTATTFSGNITGTAATFTGNVSIAGTLTYEDVTNVDSVGLVTARTGVRINTGGLVVTAGVSTFSDTTDFKGATETVSVGSTYLISSGRIILECDAQNGTVFTHTLSTGDNVGIVSLRNFPGN
jgi:hypothetical protein